MLIACSTMEIKRYDRVIEGEPSDHQRRFLYIPLPIFRKCTNIRDIIEQYHGRKDKKPRNGIEIENKIKKIYSELGQLERWSEWHLDKLDYIWPKNVSERA